MSHLKLVQSSPAPAELSPAEASSGEASSGELTSAAPAAPPSPPESGESPYAAWDRTLHAAFGRMTGGLSPASLGAAYLDWATHLMVSPGKQLELAELAGKLAREHLAFAQQCVAGAPSDPAIDALPHDNRFRDPAWCQPPYNFLAHGFLAAERWWEAATSTVRGVSEQHRNVVTFTARQMLDLASPTNFVWSNPLVAARTRAEGGANLLRGVANLNDDLARLLKGLPPAGMEAYKVGENLAVTPGKVVARTPLAEIIQYAATTPQVHPEPVVIVPAWIMKYYILDLSAENSLVKYLVEAGYTVFMVSWKNPGPEDRDVGFDDYRRQGVMAAIDAATAITGAARVHGVGYCLGGTLATIAAAAMVRDGDERLASLSLFAAQTDFSEAGELMLFIDESQLAFLEDLMRQDGYLDARQMTGAFQMLRSYDLVWSRAVRDYLIGERTIPIDIMAWNADATRMPARMHSEYLRALFLRNDLAEGRFKADGRPVAIPDIRAPIFAVGTEKDHIAPWRSVYKLNLLADTEVTFALTNGGHNAGILSAPGHPRRHFRLATRAADDRHVDAQAWFDGQQPHPGSWWSAWVEWLDRHSGPPAALPPLGRADAGYGYLMDAPGSYVFMK